MNEDLPKTLFLDIDGTLVEHKNPNLTSLPSHKMNVLDGTIEKLLEWNKKGYTIILVTGRRESNREITVKQLQEAGIFYDQLIMGIGRGPRVVVNDLKPNGIISAYSFNIVRDSGVKSIDL